MQNQWKEIRRITDKGRRITEGTCKRIGNVCEYCSELRVCRCIEDILIDVIRLLYPEDTFETGTIRGYSQGDWQDYIVKGDVDTDLLEAMYFGKISDITVTTGEEEFGDVITHDELWRAEREEGLKEFFRNHYELDKDEEIHILQADGYKQVVDWKAVG